MRDSPLGVGMGIFPTIHNAISEYLRSEAGMKLKDAIRPLKHALFGKNHIYKVVEMVGDMERKAGNAVTTVFDLGAAIGEAALPMARAFPEATVYCFEPLPDSFARLKDRTKPFADRMKYFNYGLYDREGRIEFNVLPNRDGSTILPIADLPVPGKDEAKKISIPVRRLDDVVKELRIKKIHFMKVDVEGVERKVFEGGSETLKNCVDNIFVEINMVLKGRHSHDYIDVFELLHKAGFSFIGVWGDFFFSKLKEPWNS